MVTYIPRQLPQNALESAFLPNSEKWLQTCCVERSLEVEILDVKVQRFASLSTFDSEVKPCSKPNKPKSAKVWIKDENQTYLKPVYL